MSTFFLQPQLLSLTFKTTCSEDNEILVFSRADFLIAVGNAEAIIKGTAEKAINLSNLLIFGMGDEAGVMERNAWN